MNQKAKFEGYIRSVASDDKHPLQSDIEFVFTDFSPNENNQGVPREEASNLIRTGIHMPVVIDFVGDRVGDHENCLPIGVITSMEQLDDLVVSKGIVWQDRYPDVVKHLRETVASEGGVQFSWELYHKDSDLDVNGVKWLKDCIVAGVAIVNTPAYSGRTPLLSIASTRVKELEQEVDDLRKEYAVTRSDMSPEEMRTLIESALKEQLNAFFTSIQTATAELVVSEDSEEVKNLRAKVDDLEAFKKSTEDKEARAALRTSRADALKDILSQDDFQKQEEFIIGLSDEQFTKYVENVSQVARQAKASVSKGSGLIPDPVVGEGEVVALSDLAKALREYKKR